MHHTKGMFKPRVHRPGIYHVSKPKLANPAESLKDGVIDDFSFPVIQLNETMYWISDFVRSSHSLKNFSESVFLSTSKFHFQHVQIHL